MKKLQTFLFIIILFFSGCSKNIPTPKQRLDNAFSLKDEQTIQKNIETDNFNIFSFQNVSQTCENINIYIEGDGLAWISRNRISSDPTPVNPVGLKLMNIDQSSCKIYLARPCQYISSKNCEKKYWTSHRFNGKIIDSYVEALDSIKNEHKNKYFTLIGYSGGGAVALLTASQRDDIKKIVTVAGNIDIEKWIKIHSITPLRGSLNPANYSEKLKDTRQYHLIGKDDHIVPKEVFLSYQNRFENKSNINYKLYDATHTENWEKSYKEFLEKSKYF